jgi:hypothetical protein
MFLAHFSSTPIPVLLEMEIGELRMWYEAAIKIHSQLNKSN